MQFSIAALKLKSTEEKGKNTIDFIDEEEEILLLSEIFKVLADPTRLKIIYALSKGALCVCDIAQKLNMTQSAISHHLRLLRNLRLVKYRKEGKQVIYSLDDDHVLQLFNQGLDHVKHQWTRPAKWGLTISPHFLNIVVILRNNLNSYNYFCQNRNSSLPI